jgi:hypothetical protein
MPARSITIDAVERDPLDLRLNALLDRVISAERAALRLGDTLGPPLSFDEVFDYYESARFLYGAKLKELEPRLESIRKTWSRLLEADRRVFRFLALRGVVDGALTPRSAICAWAYTGTTWQGQHLVTAEPHTYTGTLAVMMELIEWLHTADVPYARLLFRPTNRGVSHLFSGLTQQLPSDRACLSVVDYGTTRIDRLRLPAADPSVSVAATPASAQLAHGLYHGLVHPVELRSLELSDPELGRIGDIYGSNGLMRGRAVFVAMKDERPLGAVIVNHGSEGINFSLLENAIEYLYVSPGLAPDDRRAVWSSLMQAAVAEVATRRDYVVAALDPSHRELAVACGLCSPDPKQYAVLTVDHRDDCFLRSIAYFADCYRALVLAAASQGGRA